VAGVAAFYLSSSRESGQRRSFVLWRFDVQIAMQVRRYLDNAEKMTDPSMDADNEPRGKEREE
jgi:hypothetical protein